MPVQRSIDSAIDVGKALELRWRGMSFEDIGKVFGVTKQSVTMRLSRFKAIVADPALPSIFDNHALGLLKAVHLQCLVALQRKLDHPKSTVNNLAFASKQLFDQVRLLEGKSTSNVSNLTRIIIQAHKLQEQGTDNAPSALESIPSDLSGPLEASTARTRELAPKRKGGRPKRSAAPSTSVGASVVEERSEENAESVGHGGD